MGVIRKAHPAQEDKCQDTGMVLSLKIWKKKFKIAEDDFLDPCHPYSFVR